MKKELKDYLPFYIGCEVFGTYMDVSGSRGYLTGITNGGTECEIQFILEDGINVEEEPVFNTIDEVKLILRRLEDITEEEILEAVVLKFGWLNRDVTEQKIKRVVRIKDFKTVAKYGTAIPYSAHDENDKHLMTATLSQNQLNPDQFRYLLSKGFDLFNLIPSGLAQEKTIK